MKKWGLISVVLLLALSLFTSTTYVYAEDSEVPALTVEKTSDKTSATLHEVITYTYTITNNTDDVTFENLSLNDTQLGDIFLDITTLGPGESLTVDVPYTVTISDLSDFSTSITNSATVTATVQGQDPAGEPVSADSTEVTVLLTIDKRSFTKSEILQISGVPGQGIVNAPGLQKPFNPNSQAAEHAGKKSNPNSQAAQHAGPKK